MERSKNPVFRLIGMKLQGQLDDAKDQPLPQRWIDLIRHLDEQERQRSNDSTAEPSNSDPK